MGGKNNNGSKKKRDKAKGSDRPTSQEFSMDSKTNPTDSGEAPSESDRTSPVLQQYHYIRTSDQYNSSSGKASDKNDTSARNILINRYKKKPKPDRFSDAAGLFFFQPDDYKSPYEPYYEFGSDLNDKDPNGLSRGNRHSTRRNSNGDNANQSQQPRRRGPRFAGFLFHRQHHQDGNQNLDPLSRLNDLYPNHNTGDDSDGDEEQAAINAQRTTPLHEAARLGSPTLVRLFLNAGGNPNVKNGTMRTALHMAAGGLSKVEAELVDERLRTIQEEKENEQKSKSAMKKTNEASKQKDLGKTKGRAKGKTDKSSNDGSNVNTGANMDEEDVIGIRMPDVGVDSNLGSSFPGGHEEYDRLRREQHRNKKPFASFRKSSRKLPTGSDNQLHDLYPANPTMNDGTDNNNDNNRKEESSTLADTESAAFQDGASCAVQRMDTLLLILSWCHPQDGSPNAGDGPSLNAVDNLGRTALHYASELGRTEACLCILNSFGTLLTILDETGQTPCELAAKQGYPELAAQLEARSILYIDPYGMDEELLATVYDERQLSSKGREALVPPFAWFETWDLARAKDARAVRVELILWALQETVILHQRKKNSIESAFCTDLTAALITTAPNDTAGATASNYAADATGTTTEKTRDETAPQSATETVDEQTAEPTTKEDKLAVEETEEETNNEEGQGQDEMTPTEAPSNDSSKQDAELAELPQETKQVMTDAQGTDKGTDAEQDTKLPALLTETKEILTDTQDLKEDIDTKQPKTDAESQSKETHDDAKEGPPTTEPDVQNDAIEKDGIDENEDTKPAADDAQDGKNNDDSNQKQQLLTKPDTGAASPSSGDLKQPSVSNDDNGKDSITRLTGNLAVFMKVLHRGHAEKMLKQHNWDVTKATNEIHSCQDLADLLPELNAIVESETKQKENGHSGKEKEHAASPNVDNNPETTTDETASMMCPICCDTFQPDSEEWKDLPSCHHGFCRDCLGDYISECARSKETDFVIACPHHECQVIISPSDIRDLAPSKQVFQSLTKAATENFVAAAADVTYCPKPGCEGIVYCPKPDYLKSHKLDHDLAFLTGAVCIACSVDPGPETKVEEEDLTYEGVYDPNYTATAGNTQPIPAHRFCFKCGEEPHWPVSCEDLELWKTKIKEEIGTVNDEIDTSDNNDDIAQKLWIRANTRPCPKCKAPIQKDDGCNHMTCTNRACRHEFCWICRQDWKLHNTETGGFFRCNRWQEDDKHEYYDTAPPPEERLMLSAAEASASDNHYGTALHSTRVAMKQSKEMDRFLHHFQRWNAHSDSAALEQNTASGAAARMIPVVNAAIDFHGDDTFNFGGKGESLLGSCSLFVFVFVVSWSFSPLPDCAGIHSPPPCIRTTAGLFVLCAGIHGDRISQPLSSFVFSANLLCVSFVVLSLPTQDWHSSILPSRNCWNVGGC